MTGRTESLSAYVGIDAGSSCSKLGYSDNLSTRVIARLDGFDATALREESEIFFDEPVYSCVIAANPGVNLRASAELSGFRDIEIITSHEAIITALNYHGRALVYDFGASRSEFVVLNSHEVIECVNVPDVCGNNFDQVFADYLADRRLTDNPDLREAKRIKHVLSTEENIMWHGINIFREDFTRLVRFSIKRAVHVADRLSRVHKPERFILSGGGVNIPEVINAFADMTPEIAPDLIVTGSSQIARTLSRDARKNTKPADTAPRLRELRAGIIELEERLTRAQKDRIYMLFRQAEGSNDAGLIAILQNMIYEIKAIS